MPTKSRETLRRLARGSRGGILSVERAVELLSEPRKQVANRLAVLSRQGWLARVRRGLYVILPLESNSAGPLTVEDPWILARELFFPCYIGGWSAAEHWGLTEQLFRSTFVVSGASPRLRSVRFLEAEFTVVRVARMRLAGATAIWRGAEKVMVSDRERTIVDALNAPDWVGGVRHLIDMLTTYSQTPAWDLPKLLRELETCGRGAAFKRFGFILEHLWPHETKSVQRALARRTSGYIKLDPSVRGRGTLNRRWGLWVNVSLGTLSDK